MSSGFKLIRFLKPHWRWAVLAPLLMLLEVMMDLMQPRMVQRIVDQGIARLDLTLVINTGLLMVGLALAGAAGGLGCGITAEMAAQSFGADLREALFGKVQSLSFGNLDLLDTGQLITRLTSDVNQSQEAIAMMLRILVRAPLLLVGSLVMAILTSPQLAWIPVVLMPVELIAVIWVVRKATPLYSVVQARLDALNEVMQENLAGVRVVKAFVRAVHEVQRFGRANDALTEQSVSAARIGAVMPSFMMVTLNFGIIGVLWFGGIQVSQGGMQDGQIIAFANYLTTTLFSLMMVSQLVMQFARAEASARRVQEVFDQQPEVQDPPADPAPLQGRVATGSAAFAIHGLSSAPSGRGRVEFENVSFRYNGRDSDPVLKGISFNAEAGQSVAILGTTGAGKSSLVHLIPRFYDTEAGSIRIDGVDVRALDQENLRRKIGIAMQEVVLFSGTIRDNIRYGRPEAGDEEVIAAAQAAQAHDFICAFPEGYDTQLGQRGVNLSGGQKQRIAIARALLLQPDVLILDDSTSAVDVETEVKIQDALEGMAKRSTSFVIAQRISTVLKADKILLLDDGQIVGEGTHRELLESSPIYRDIYESQLGSGGNNQ
jgi:ATP-binding cassette, subfamily B, multidrug efflux pump